VLLRHTIAAHMLTCPCLEVAPCPRGPFEHEQLLLHERPVPNPGSALPCQPLHRPLLSEPVDTALAMHHRHRMAPEQLLELLCMYAPHTRALDTHKWCPRKALRKRHSGTCEQNNPAHTTPMP